MRALHGFWNTSNSFSIFDEFSGKESPQKFKARLATAFRVWEAGEFTGIKARAFKKTIS